MASRKLLDKLIPLPAIEEEIRLIAGSETDYISESGNIYKDYGNNLFYRKANFINKANGYLYCNITYPEGQRQRRVHVLVARAYLDNPNNLPIVMHKDNNKMNPHVSNLQWGTVAENTKQAFDDGLEINAKSWDDSQSIPICAFDLQGNLLNKFGSVSEAARELNYSKSGIIYQCNHEMKSKPRKGYYFRYLNEYEEKGFVL